MSVLNQEYLQLVNYCLFRHVIINMVEINVDHILDWKRPFKMGVPFEEVLKYFRLQMQVCVIADLQRLLILRGGY